MNVSYDKDPDKKESKESRRTNDWPIVVFFLGTIFSLCATAVMLVWVLTR